MMSLCLYIVMFLMNTFFQFVELMKSMSGKDAFLLMFTTMALGICMFVVWVAKEDD